jgi:hypothetical protein
MGMAGQTVVLGRAIRKASTYGARRVARRRETVLLGVRCYVMCDAFCNLFGLLHRITRRDENAVEPHGHKA